MDKKKILFLVNRKKDKDLSISNEILNYLSLKNVEIYIEKEFKNDFPSFSIYNNEKVDLGLVLGGDGTILNFAHIYFNIPFFGINLGRVGCLTDSSLEESKQKIDLILSNKYFIEERNVINCKIYDNNKIIHEMIAFNEVYVHRGQLFKMLSLNLTINNHNKTSFFADGVILATATGSSAYSLSCGGPLLLPNAKNFVITPIAPQLRVITSLVINDTDTIELNVFDIDNREEFIDQKPVVIIDGKYRYEFDKHYELKVSKSDTKLQIIKTNKEASLFEPNLKVSLSTNDNHRF